MGDKDKEVVVVEDDYSHVPIDDTVLNSTFAQTKADASLRVCCFGSSAQLTPEAYLQEARNIGYVLAKRGHVSVNGAGSFGCMAAMNDGACRGNGHIIGVIHEMWLVDSPAQKPGAAAATEETKRDGTFHKALSAKAVKPNSNNNTEEQSFGGPHTALSPSGSKEDNGSDHPRRELLVAGGKDLQERKRLLVENADALVVLPGGPGTFDELWEMACARNIGLSSLPIVCVNVNGFYNSFYDMLVRAYQDKLTKLQPDDIIHFENTAVDAIRWVEDIQQNREMKITIAKRRQDTNSMLRKTSVLNPPAVFTGGWGDNIRRSLSRSLSFISDAIAGGAGAGAGANTNNPSNNNRAKLNINGSESWIDEDEQQQQQQRGLFVVKNGLIFTAGLTVGVLLTMTAARARFAGGCRN